MNTNPGIRHIETLLGLSPATAGSVFATLRVSPQVGNTLIARIAAAPGAGQIVPQGGDPWTEETAAIGVGYVGIWRMPVVTPGLPTLWRFTGATAVGKAIVVRLEEWPGLVTVSDLLGGASNAGAVTTIALPGFGTTSTADEVVLPAVGTYV